MCMVQPTSRSVIGSNQRDDSIQKREVFPDFDDTRRRAVLRRRPSSSRPPPTRVWTRLLHHFTGPFLSFPATLSPLRCSPATLGFLLRAGVKREQWWRRHPALPFKIKRVAQAGWRWLLRVCSQQLGCYLNNDTDNRKIVEAYC